MLEGIGALGLLIVAVFLPPLILAAILRWLFRVNHIVSVLEEIRAELKLQRKMSGPMVGRPVR